MRQGIEELKKETSRLREENLRYNRMAEEAESAMDAYASARDTLNKTVMRLQEARRRLEAMLAKECGIDIQPRDGGQS